MLSREECVNDEWSGHFPFVADFEQVVGGALSIEYVSQLACVLEPAVELLSKQIEIDGVTQDLVRVLFFSIVALARCRVALAYESEVVDLSVDRAQLLSVIEGEWDAMQRREGFVYVEYSSVIDAFLGDSVRMLWTTFSMQHFYTLRDLAARYPKFLLEFRVVSLAQVFVVSSDGIPFDQALKLDPDKPVLSVSAYRAFLAHLRVLDDLSCDIDPASFVMVDVSDFERDGSGHVGADVYRSWLWLLHSPSADLQGFCYQRLFPPSRRFGVCLLLGSQPLVVDVLTHVGAGDECWASALSVIRDGDVLHVETVGSPDVLRLRHCGHKRVGMLKSESSKVEVDYYARALVDEFLAKHKPLPLVPEVPQALDTAFDVLSVSSESPAGREFIDVAAALYAGVDESVSPRAEHADAVHADFGLSDDHVSERDSEIVRDVYNRLADGAVINEGYFQRTYRRFRKFHRRPRMDQSDGRMYHVFEGFPADGGIGSGPWQPDVSWGIPGWRSYVAEFDPGEVRTVSFAVADGCQDIRMDCSGDGAIEFGDCKVKVSGTLLWFTNSVRLRLTAKTKVCLRISVPDALRAIAMGTEMRKYMHIPGYAIVARSFEVVTGRVDFSVPMERVKRSSIAGCHVFTGQRYVERGRHRFKLSQMFSLAPARVLFKTDPPEALEFISVCGMRLYPRTRDHVSVLIDLRNVEMYVSIVTSARFMVSMMQVVKVKEYELAVISTAEAKSVALRQQSIS